MHTEKHLKGPNSAKFKFQISTRTSIFLFFKGYKRRFLGGDPSGKNCQISGLIRWFAEKHVLPLRLGNTPFLCRRTNFRSRMFIILIINDFVADMIGKKITVAYGHSFLLLKDYDGVQHFPVTVPANSKISAEHLQHHHDQNQNILPQPCNSNLHSCERSPQQCGIGQEFLSTLPGVQYREEGPLQSTFHHLSRFLFH